MTTASTALSTIKQLNPYEADGVLFAYIYDEEMGKMGDVTLFPEGNACVMDDWGGNLQWFDRRDTGHLEALEYIMRRLTPEPIFK